MVGYGVKEQEKMFKIEKQIERHFVEYGKCLSNPSSLLCNSNNKPFYQFNNLSQTCKRGGISSNGEIIIPLLFL